MAPLKELVKKKVHINIYSLCCKILWVLANARDWTSDIEFGGTPIYMTDKAMQAWSPRDSSWNEKQKEGAQNPGTNQYLRVRRRKGNQKKRVRKNGSQMYERPLTQERQP